jgi:hypothetical protein
VPGIDWCGGGSVGGGSVAVGCVFAVGKRKLEAFEKLLPTGID